MASFNKKIPQLPLNESPSATGYTIFDDGSVTYSVKAGEFIDTKHWLYNENKIIESNKTVVINGDYVLENSNLTLESSGIEYLLGPLSFKKESQMYVGGNLLLLNSNIINNGKISIGGGLILSGTSSVTGTGIII